MEQKDIESILTILSSVAAVLGLGQIFAKYQDYRLKERQAYIQHLEEQIATIQRVLDETRKELSDIHNSKYDRIIDILSDMGGKRVLSETGQHRRGISTPHS